jgi:hypothetical protein
MTRGLGFLAVHARAIHAEPEIAARIADLLVDPRWPWPLNLVRPTPKPGAPDYTWPAGKVAHARLASLALDVLRSDRTLGLHVAASRNDELNHVFAHIDAGHADYTGRPEGTALPFEAKLFCRAERVPPDSSLDAWVELLHELVVLLDAPSAVIFARPDERHTWSLLYGTGSRRSDQPPDHPHNENARIAAARRTLGHDRIRPPEWGTYLAPVHVEQVGRARLVAAVAVARDVGKLLYLQCSERAADAFTDEARARRRALAALLAPVTVA